MLSFEAATKPTQTSSHTYTCNLQRDWCIGTVPHGGYITSCFMRVARLHFETTLAKQNQPHTIALHLTFLRRTEVGEGTFTVADVKIGRQTSTLHVKLTQRIAGDDGADRGVREEVVGYITQSNLDAEDGVSFKTAWQLAPKPITPPILNKFSPVDGGSGRGDDPNWVELSAIPFADFRKASQRVRWLVPRAGQQATGMSEVWFSLSNPGETFSQESLGFVADMFPQLVEMHGPDVPVDPYRPGEAENHQKGKDTSQPTARFWYPTVCLNLDIKKSLPEDGVDWLYVRTLAKSVKNGRYDLEVIVLDERGDLLVVSNHVVLAVSASRNVAKRNTQKDTRL